MKGVCLQPQFARQLMGIKGRAMKGAAVDLKSGHFALAAVHALDELRRLGMRFDVDLFERQLALLQEFFGAAAIGAPGRRVDADQEAHDRCFDPSLAMLVRDGGNPLARPAPTPLLPSERKLAHGNSIPSYIKNDGGLVTAWKANPNLPGQTD